MWFVHHLGKLSSNGIYPHHILKNKINFVGSYWQNDDCVIIIIKLSLRVMAWMMNSSYMAFKLSLENI
jgi:hypothetical protein